MKQSNKLTIKYISDIHYSKYFSDKRLFELLTKLKDGKTDYIFIVGDIIDSVDIIIDEHEKCENLVSWFTELSKICPIIIAFGNHENLSRKDYDINAYFKEINSFWKKISSIPNVHVLYLEKSYSDDNIFVSSIEVDAAYYAKKREEKGVLLNSLKNKQTTFKRITNEKLNIFLFHSPVYLADKDILKYLKDFDVLISGHMHNGLMPDFLGKRINNNRGIISRYKRLFPDNARGTKIVEYGNKKIHLMISGGITKLARPETILGKLNILFPMSIHEFKYDKKSKEIDEVK